MPKRIKHDRPTDINQLANYLVTESTRESGSPDLPTKAQVSFLMAEMGRKGGKIGGKRRLETMTSKQRKQVAKKAARARWKKKDKPKGTM
jgi:hypothetical protein